MKYFRLIILFLVVSLLAISCKRKGQSTDLSHSGKKEVVISKFAGNYPGFNPDSLKVLLYRQIQSDSVLQPFYENKEQIAIWLHDTLDTKSLYGFLEIVNDVEAHGLSAEIFPISEIGTLIDSIDAGMFAGNLETLYSKVSLVEQKATESAIKYITGMRYGFITPRSVYGKKNYDIIVAESDSAYQTVLRKELKENPIAAILNSHPTDSMYIRLQDEYKVLSEIEKSAPFPKINSGSVTFKPGDKSRHISEIAERLIITGEYRPDSISGDSTHRELNKDMLAAINLFRKKNSYPEENEVGKLTIDALNRPVSYYKDKIRANMERYRWRRTKATHSKHIEVNVAAASLVATQTDSLPIYMRVCVGTVSNKTPLLQSNIGYLNLNPYWNVPKSIAQGEVAVLQKRDSSYIRRKNMKLYKGGKEVNPSSINWKEVNPGTFSYIVRQDPGNGNSLGLIKFMFNNNHSVYLHDTPSKLAFTRKNRAVSHGCVRVQKPFDLAFFCLSPVTDVYKDQLLYTVKMNPVSIGGKRLLRDNKLQKLPDIINLKADNKISLFIDYYTAYTYPDDETLYYADDIYGYDDLILNALFPQERSIEKLNK